MFFKPSEIEESRDKIMGVLETALQDISFREQLLSNPSEALKNSGLNPAEINLLAGMRRVQLEEYGIDVRQYRAILRDNGYLDDGGLRC